MDKLKTLLKINDDSQKWIKVMMDPNAGQQMKRLADRELRRMAQQSQRAYIGKKKIADGRKKEILKLISEWRNGLMKGNARESASIIKSIYSEDEYNNLLGVIIGNHKEQLKGVRVIFSDEVKGNREGMVYFKIHDSFFQFEYQKVKSGFQLLFMGIG